MSPIRLSPLALALLLAACDPSNPAPVDPSAAAVPATTAAAAAAPTGGTDPVDTIDPQPTAPAPTPGELAEVHNDPAVVSFAGFGPATFGADEEAVRQAWGRPLTASPPAEGSTCTYLMPEVVGGNGYGIAFMLEEGRFVRYDVNTPEHVAPGDLTTGMAAADVAAKFPGRVEEQPGKYDPGTKTLIVSPEDGGAARLVFSVDAAGTITSWRIGVPPQVHYVEGCS